MRKEGILIVVALIMLSYGATANFAPLLGETDDKLVICESSALSYLVGAVDRDGDALIIGLSPSGPFFARQVSFEPPFTQIEIFSGNLTKEQANKVYEETLFVADREFIDIKKINITVLEVNNPPSIEHLGVETRVLNETKPFYKKVSVSDIESPQNSGQFTFSVMDLTGELSPNINDFGIINLTQPDKAGLHSIRVCATDSGIQPTEQAIGFCGEGDLRKSACREFQLSVVETDAAPTILLYNSTNLGGQLFGTESVSFQIYKFDPDGIIPDTYWYVDNLLKKIDSGKPTDKFNYSFGCGAWGEHKIRAVITDGLFNDSVQWEFDVVKITCGEGIVPGERIEKDSCKEEWGCYEWGLCQNAAQSVGIRVLAGKDYEKIKSACTESGWNEEVCGFQVRSCVDLSKCNTINSKPSEISQCYFSLKPSCSDNIQNCHDGKCEFFIDCGGPCKPCPTCSDRIKNQGEWNKDCGGPCFEQCPTRIVSEKEKSLNQAILFVILVLIIIAFIQGVRAAETKKKLEIPSRRKTNEKK